MNLDRDAIYTVTPHKAPHGAIAGGWHCRVTGEPRDGLVVVQEMKPDGAGWRPGMSTQVRADALAPLAAQLDLLTLAAPAGECDECGEDAHPGTPCRTPAEILAECAPPADYAARFRAERAASIARADANRPGAAPMRIRIRTSDTRWAAAHGQPADDDRTVVTVPAAAVEPLTYCGRAMLRFNLRAVAKRLPADWPNPWAMVPAAYALAD